MEELLNDSTNWDKLLQVLKLTVDMLKSRIYKSDEIWSSLVLEQNFALLDKLQRIEKNEPGFGTIIIPKDGFSKNETLNKQIIAWLKRHKINVYSIDQEIKSLDSLTCQLAQKRVNVLSTD